LTDAEARWVWPMREVSGLGLLALNFGWSGFLF